MMLKFCGLFDDVEIDVFYEKTRIRKKRHTLQYTQGWFYDDECYYC